MDEIITLSYGSGGKKTSELIDKIIVPAFNNEELNELKDGAVINTSSRSTFSTDSFVIDPYIFPGGDIGKLCVCGTVNDVCMCGGIPKYLSLALIIEEGFKTKDLIQIVNSIKITAAKCNVKIVTGDTKVVEKGKGDGIFINTAGIGELVNDRLGIDRIKEGDSIIVTGNVGDHGIAIMCARNNLITGVNLLSDCTPLNRLASELNSFEDSVKIMRDPTRGGLATTLNEFIQGTSLTAEIEEELVPIDIKVRDACDVLGIDPLYSANEGKIVAVVDSSAADEIVEKLRKYPEGANAAVIGKVTKNFPDKVILKTPIGGRRILTKLSGNQLPRIC